MSGLLEAMAAGEAGAFDCVLQNCRFEGFGTQAYGSESIRELFRKNAAPIRDTLELAGPTFAAMIAVDTRGRPAGLFADLHHGSVTRLWSLGGTRANAAPTPRVAVPDDLDLDQRGARLAFEPALFPDLSSTGATAIETLGTGWVRTPPAEIAEQLERPRFFVLRAGADDERVTAFLRVEGAANDQRVGCYALVVADQTGADIHVAVDHAGLAASVAFTTAMLRGESFD